MAVLFVKYCLTKQQKWIMVLSVVECDKRCSRRLVTDRLSLWLNCRKRTFSASKVRGRWPFWFRAWIWITSALSWNRELWVADFLNRTHSCSRYAWFLLTPVKSRYMLPVLSWMVSYSYWNAEKCCRLNNIINNFWIMKRFPVMHFT